MAQMSPALNQSPSTYSFERVEQILQRYLHIREPDAIGVPPEFSVRRMRAEQVGDVYEMYTLERQQERAATLCRDCFAQIQDPTDHLSRLDLEYTKVLQTNFQAPESRETVTQKTCQLLERLPATPPAFDDEGFNELSSSMFDGYFLPNCPQTWENLQVVKFVDTNVVRMGLQIERGGTYYKSNKLKEFVDTIAELLDAAFLLSTNGSLSLPGSFILRAFLWTSWQRATMLHFVYALKFHIDIGYDYSRNTTSSLKRTTMLRKFAQTSRNKNISMSQQSGQENSARYLCNWAFELLRSDRASIGLDFRIFHERYSQVFGHLPPRCITSNDRSISQCNGRSPFGCMRFKGMKIQDQSAHASSCTGGCPKLFWDEQSYRNASMARAVLVDSPDEEGLLKYCTASTNTLAISHVWSHGQGGRPESISANGTGFNRCLHNRYKVLSRSFGCSSYWMDTPCIPQDHELRQEAISHINTVFANSKVTLVCDIDIMKININNNMTEEEKESILAVLLVCDWNVRAWTLLEAMRGRSNIHLLCKDEQSICLKDLLRSVVDRGRIDLSTLFLTAQHLLPAQSPPPDTPWIASLDRRAKGYISVQEAACLLSHRHASRKGDEVVIWSLLCGDRASYTASEFWKNKLNDIIPTGFLMSSLPRVGRPRFFSRGTLGWAPCRPDFPERKSQSRTKAYFTSDGSGSEYGLIKKHGFEAEWLVKQFNGGLLSIPTALRDNITSRASQTEHRLLNIARRFLKLFLWGALLQPLDEFKDGAVGYPGEADGTLVAIVGSNDRLKWHWKCVYEWDQSISLPVFTAKTLLIT